MGAAGSGFGGCQIGNQILLHHKFICSHSHDQMDTDKLKALRGKVVSSFVKVFKKVEVVIGDMIEIGNIGGHSKAKRSHLHLTVENGKRVKRQPADICSIIHKT